MTQPEETEMDKTSDATAPLDTQQDVCELGVVSTDTKGKGVGTEIISNGENPLTGISEE